MIIENNNWEAMIETEAGALCSSDRISASRVVNKPLISSPNQVATVFLKGNRTVQVKAKDIESFVLENWAELEPRKRERMGRSRVETKTQD